VSTVVKISVGFVIGVFGLAALSEYESSAYPWVALAGAVTCASPSTLHVSRRFQPTGQSLRFSGLSKTVMLILCWIIVFGISWLFLYAISQVGVV